MNEVAITDARDNFADTIRRARKSPIRITNHGEVQVVILDASTYEKMIEDLEELDDISAFDAALEDSTPGVPWDQVKKDLGLI